MGYEAGMFRAGSRSVGLAVLAAIVLVLAIYLVITWVVGDDTNQLEERQPSPHPESAPLIGSAGRLLDGVAGAVHQ
jgi:amino acid transporter